MLKRLAAGTAVLGLVLALATNADAQRHGGGGRGGSWSGGHSGNWSGHSGSWGGNHWGGHNGFAIYAPGFGFGYGYGYGYPYYGGGYYQPYYGGGYYSNDYYMQPYAYSQPYYNDSYYSSNMPYSQGYEEAEQGAQPAITQPRGDEAMVRVLVPNADARVTFDGYQTQQRGMQRTFTTTLPERNKDFTYMVRATWTEDGREMKRERKVKVRAGQPVTVDFRQDSGRGGDGTINRDQNRDNRDQGILRDNNRDQGTTTPRPNPKTRDDSQPDRQP